MIPEGCKKRPLVFQKVLFQVLFRPHFRRRVRVLPRLPPLLLNCGLVHRAALGRRPPPRPHRLQQSTLPGDRLLGQRDRRGPRHPAAVSVCVRSPQLLAVHLSRAQADWKNRGQVLLAKGEF